MEGKPTGKEAYDHLVKILLIGDSTVGKSSLLLRFTEDSFTPNLLMTIGIDFKIRTINMDGQRVKLQVWDTAGQERYRVMTNAFYRGAMGIFLVYDVTKEASFRNVKNWMINIQQHAREDVIKVLVGNKCDVEDAREIQTAKGQAYASEQNIKFFETSAKTGVGVDDAFLYLAREIKKNVLDKNPDLKKSDSPQRDVVEYGPAPSVGKCGCS